MSNEQSDLAQLMRILDQVAGQATGLPPKSRKERRAAARSGLKQARAEDRETSRSNKT